MHRTPALVTTLFGARLPDCSSASVQARVRPHPLSCMQADTPSPICPHRRTGDANHANPVFAFRASTASVTVPSHAA